MKEWINPVEGAITSIFGYRVNPVLNKEEFHDGIDIAAGMGTPVAAVRDGVVTKAGWSNTYGNYITFITEDGYEIKYAHLSKTLAENGDTVRQGQIIAESGNTGLTTGPHLHYSITEGEGFVDPGIYVSLEYTKKARSDYLSVLGLSAVNLREN